MRFEGSDSFQEYLFGVRRDKVILGYWNNLDIWQTVVFEDADLNSGDNTITVRKVYDKFYFFLNGEFISDLQDSLFDGHQVRLRAGTDTDIRFEDLQIKQVL